MPLPFENTHAYLQGELNCLVELETKLSLLIWVAEKRKYRNRRREKVRHLPTNKISESKITFSIKLGEAF